MNDFSPLLNEGQFTSVCLQSAGIFMYNKGALLSPHSLRVLDMDITE